MKKTFLILSSLFLFVLAVTVTSNVKGNNPGDIGSSVLGDHESLKCVYQLTTQTTTSFFVDITEIGGSGGGSTTSTYGSGLAGHADHCSGFWGWCSASGSCQPNL